MNRNRAAREKKRLKIEIGKAIRKYYLMIAERNEKGEILCPLKNKYYREEQMQVAHYKDRRFIGTRYFPNNLLLVSKESNTFDATKGSDKGFKSKHHEDFYDYLEEVIGREGLEELEQISGLRINKTVDQLYKTLKLWEFSIDQVKQAFYEEE